MRICNLIRSSEVFGHSGALAKWRIGVRHSTGFALLVRGRANWRSDCACTPSMIGIALSHAQEGAATALFGRGCSDRPTCRTRSPSTCYAACTTPVPWSASVISTARRGPWPVRLRPSRTTLRRRWRPLGGLAAPLPGGRAKAPPRRMVNSLVHPSKIFGA